MKKLIAMSSIVVLALAACGDSPEETLGAFCDSQDALVERVEAALNLSATSTLEEVQTARDDVSAAWDDYRQKAEDLGDVVVDAADNAYGRYVDAVGAIPDDATVAGAYAAVNEAADAYYAELRAISASVDCP